MEEDEVLSLDAGVALIVDPDELSFIAQPSLITLAQLRLSFLYKRPAWSSMMFYPQAGFIHWLILPLFSPILM